MGQPNQELRLTTAPVKFCDARHKPRRLNRRLLVKPWCPDFTFLRLKETSRSSQRQDVTLSLNHRLTTLGVLALLLSGCAGNPPMETAYRCFEHYGLLVFDSSGDIKYMSEAEYVLSPETNNGELAVVTDQ